MTRRTALVIGAALVVVAATLAAALVIGPSRMRQWVMQEDPAGGIEPMATPMPPAGGTARGDVTIDTRRQQLIGVRTARATRLIAAATIRAVGTVRHDETRLKEINVKVDGWIRRLNVDYVGKRVRIGDPLFTLYSPEVLATEREYLLAVRTRNALAQSRVADVHQHADQLVDAARQRLALWDIPSENIAALEKGQDPQGVVVFRSPVEGVVLEKQAVEGMHVTAGQALYTLVDLSTVWVEVDFYERDATAVRVGTPAAITVEALPGERFQGKTLFIHPTVNEETRTLKARIALPNRGDRLKPGMFAQVELQGPSASALVVPSDAVLDSGTEQIVFLAQGEGRFRPQRVKVGRRLSEGTEILEGLKEGDEVATAAAFFLDSESQLRAAVQAYEPPPAAGSGAAQAPAASIDITLRMQPDPPKTGQNTFEVMVKDAAGAPIADAAVALQFYMPAMPTMDMPAMQNTVKLPPAGNGVYRGTGEVMMGGRWDVTVTVTKNGRRLGSKQLAVVAR